MTDKNLIERIGVSVLASEMGVSMSHVSHWKKRGVPWKLRYKVACIAADKGINLPATFLDTRSPV